ncbi:DUF4595 domain-containing protein [Bacteroides cellulosilyticus]|jgi:hypothetical protein|uniref:DUF4595 domain-containing protein n=1 Tax=Bacteroides cellulosilyticus TaxID=246787 RepID=A0A412I7Z4_9BACE|nr:DUF4595 domain-containing protein [Bacteroides cellulosilyticus]RGS32876.1 DUF4595 domain-containing protein [Bacteroides cellulosilyticus]
MKKNIFIALLFIGGLTACSDNDEGSDIPDNPGYPVTHFSKIELKEVKEEPGAPAVTVTQTYDYSAGRLINFTSTQSFVAGGELFKIENATNVVYGDHQAVVTDEINNISTYTLDDNGYAISCVRQEMDGKIRSYTFDYLINTEGKYFLKNITETLDGNKFYSSINIDYSSYRTLRITQQVDKSEQTYIASTSTGNEIANTSEIPYLFLTDLYPLSFHSVAIYGKFLGDAYNTLITDLRPEDNSGSNETTTYTYRFDKKDVDISCSELTKSYGTDYARTVDYIMK